MDEIDRKIEFIINQQAQFAADLGRLEQNMDRFETGLNELRETVSQLGDKVSQLQETVFQLTGVVSELAISQQNTNAILENLAERAVESSERLDRAEAILGHLAERDAESAERQARMDERLNALIIAVERHISDHPSSS